MLRSTLVALASVGLALRLLACGGGPAGGSSGSATGDGGSADGPAYMGDGGCQPGVPRCQGDFAYQMCADDRTWGTSLSCAGYSANGTSSYCVTIDNYGYCVDPA